MSDEHELEGADIEIVGPLFSMVPEELTFDTEVSDRGVRLYSAIHRYGNTSGKRYPSQTKLAERLGKSVNTICRAERDLVEGGWLTIIERPGRSHLVKLHTTKGPAGEVTKRQPRDSAQRGTSGKFGDTEPPANLPEPTSGKSAATTSGKSAARPRATTESNNTDRQFGSESSPKPSRVEPQPVDKGGEENEAKTVMANALAAIGIDRPPSDAEIRVVATALAKGWPAVEFDGIAAQAVEQPHDARHRYLMGGFRKRATTDPEVEPRRPVSDLGMSPPVESTPESRAAADQEYWDRVGTP